MISRFLPLRVRRLLGVKVTSRTPTYQLLDQPGSLTPLLAALASTHPDTTRVASRLFDLSKVLDVPVSFFFDDMPSALTETTGGVVGARRSWGFAEAQEGFGAAPATGSADDMLHRRETLELVRAYYRVTDPAVRKRVFDLIKSLAPDVTE